MSERKKVEDHLRGLAKTSSNCANCGLSQNLHAETTKNTCNNFTAEKQMSSHDGEARKDGWD